MTSLFNPLISELSPSDTVAACQLFQQVFGPSISPTQWDWKYTQGPRLGSVNLVAKDTQGQLLGHVGASVFEGTSRSSRLVMAQVCDVMVVPQARAGLSNQSTYTQLIHALQRTLCTRYGVNLAYGFAGLRQVKLGQRLGLYRPLQAYRPVYLQPAPHTRWSVSPWRIVAAPWDNNLLNRLWLRCAPSLHQPTVCRNAAYVQWRYRDHPVHQYQLWTITHLWRSQGWFITRTMPNGQFAVVDALLPSGAPLPTLLAGLSTALTQCNTSPVAVFTWLMQTPATLHPDAVIACEVKLQNWQTSYPAPSFHPGDTDVF